MTKFFHKFKKTLFLAHFTHFGAKMFFPKNLALSQTTSYGFLTPCQNLGKTNEPISRICLARWKDGQGLFYRTFLATARDPKLVASIF